MQLAGQKLINYFKNNDIINWSEKGEFVYKDEPVIGSNMVDLLQGILSNNNKQAKSSSSVFNDNLFKKALSEVNVPALLIKNKSKLNDIKAYLNSNRDSKPSADRSFDETKQINWLSVDDK